MYKLFMKILVLYKWQYLYSALTVFLEKYSWGDKVVISDSNGGLENQLLMIYIYT